LLNRIAVCSRSFSKHPVLRRELLERFPAAAIDFNDAGVSLAGDDLIAFARGHDGLVTALERLDGAFFLALPELRVVAKYGVGLDMIDLRAMIASGVKLGWKGGVNKRSVSELVIGCVIILLRRVQEAATNIRAGDWQQVRGRQLSERTVGIVGCGHIGKDLGRLLRAFGCRVLAHDILGFPEYYAESGVEPCGLDELLECCDIVSLHLPLNEVTRGIIDTGRLARMPTGAILVNAARGGLIDEVALKEAIKGGRLGGAVLDVFAVEPPEDREWLELPGVLVTPHIGGSSEEAVLAMGRAAIDGLTAAEVPRPGSEAWQAAGYL
jgi:phosphoglycerate dehydrogenase-like enzyme